MFFGGNQKLKDFLNKFDLGSEPIKVKYTSQAAIFYRKKLLALCNGDEAQEQEPSYEDGRKGEGGEELIPK
jgi:hypothetical protein